jgi:hypothetical protein
MSIPGVNDNDDGQQDRQCGGGGAPHAFINGRGGVCNDGGKRDDIREYKGDIATVQTVISPAAKSLLRAILRASIGP